MWEGGIEGLILAFRRYLLSIVTSSIFETSIMMSVFINTLVLALEGLVST